MPGVGDRVGFLHDVSFASSGEGHSDGSLTDALPGAIFPSLPFFHHGSRVIALPQPMTAALGRMGSNWIGKTGVDGLT
jgi:hypothetical protein